MAFLKYPSQTEEKKGVIQMPEQRPDSPFKTMFLVGAITSDLVGGTLLGLFGGRWLDKQWGTTPLFLIIGLFLGMGLGIMSVMQLVKRYARTDKK